MRYRKWREQALKDGDVRKAYEDVDDDPFIEVAHQMLRLRKKAGWTQKQLALAIGTSQQAIARLESLDYRGHSLTTLEKIAEAFHKKLRVQFV
ncbi:MAG: hypothetical protein A2X36_04875 [Elusimicrobia bacterium GWA2_69_24]|nr:MAG: hypothetical protein A2X36_04875 [Elusimicrobia bacterium GWA2_69_24]